jgi:hypothetical protein
MQKFPFRENHGPGIITVFWNEKNPHPPIKVDALAKTQRMAKQKVRVVFQGRRHTSGMSRS